MARLLSLAGAARRGPPSGGAGADAAKPERSPALENYTPPGRSPRAAAGEAPAPRKPGLAGFLAEVAQELRVRVQHHHRLAVAQRLPVGLEAAVESVELGILTVS